MPGWKPYNLLEKHTMASMSKGFNILLRNPLLTMLIFSSIVLIILPLVLYSVSVIIAVLTFILTAIICEGLYTFFIYFGNRQAHK